jgi:hypothetical protein
MPYILESLTHDDLPRILADAKTNPEIEEDIQFGFRGGLRLTPEVSSGDRWAIDRENDSYLFRSRGLGNSKIYCDGYMFFYRGKAFGVYQHTSSHVSGKRSNYVPKGMAGWVSLSRDFSTPPPQDPDFQRALTEACDVLWGGRLLGRVVFSIEQQDKEPAK